MARVTEHRAAAGEAGRPHSVLTYALHVSAWVLVARPEVMPSCGDGCGSGWRGTAQLMPKCRSTKEWKRRVVPTMVLSGLDGVELLDIQQ